MNYFKTGKLYSSGIVEGLILNIKVSTWEVSGSRSFDLMKTTHPCPSR